MLTIFKCHVAHGTVCQTVAYAAAGPSLHIFLTALQVSWMPPLRSARLRTGRFRIIKVFAANRLGCLRGMGWSLSVDNIGLQEGERYSCCSSSVREEGASPHVYDQMLGRCQGSLGAWGAGVGYCAVLSGNAGFPGHAHASPATQATPGRHVGPTQITAIWNRLFNIEKWKGHFCRNLHSQRSHWSCSFE